jgi:hypothetical protein
LDAINVVFNVIVGSVLVVGAFGFSLDAELPDAPADKSGSFTKKLSHPRPTDDGIDTCFLPPCGPTQAPPPSFVETKKVVIVAPPAPAPAPAAAAETQKHGDDHPSAPHKMGRDAPGGHVEKMREQAQQEAAKVLERTREESQKALETQRRLKAPDDRREHQEDGH